MILILIIHTSTNTGKAWLQFLSLREMIRHYAPGHGLALTAAKVALITDLAFPPP